ncbi:hypothetical protein [Azospirillum sp. TSO22-1]|uniref:hypothetical protein n=1 Tax=Azospirillum sp. TSO22-1 TaxID=716789 RepID=UPI000D61F7F7|nr:hypothetical protein [Azospirillum sp. TSO22-1]PWC37044.1 hypothetical protein TSO221_28135 [Azospirillum sp. TSO22-1]
MTAIAKPEHSVFDTAPEELRPVLESLVEAAQGDANWKVRKKTLLDALLVVETMTQLSPKQQEAFEALMAGMEDGSISEAEAKARMDAIETADDDDEEEGGEGIDILPMFIGAVLERLGEDRITSVEQAALYILSVHPEHYEAAEDWLQADEKNATAFKKLLRSDRRYAGLFDALLGEDEEEEGEDEA